MGDAEVIQNAWVLARSASEKLAKVRSLLVNGTSEEADVAEVIHRCALAQAEVEVVIELLAARKVAR